MDRDYRNSERKNGNRDLGFRQTHGGRDDFPGSEWGENSEFGRNSFFHETERYQGPDTRPYDMDNFRSASQFADRGMYTNNSRNRGRNDRDNEYSRRGYNQTQSGDPYDGNYYNNAGYPMASKSDAGFAGKGPKGYKRSDDRIREEVCEALFHSPSVDARDIEVSVKEGHVTLSGTVESRYAKREAENSIDHLNGVIDVHNQLKLKREDSSLPQSHQ